MVNGDADEYKRNENNKTIRRKNTIFFLILNLKKKQEKNAISTPQRKSIYYPAKKNFPHQPYRASFIFSIHHHQKKLDDYLKQFSFCLFL